MRGHGLPLVGPHAFFRALQDGAAPEAQTFEILSALPSFFQFRGGKIIAQRNYDCFHPW